MKVEGVSSALTVSMHTPRRQEETRGRRTSTAHASGRAASAANAAVWARFIWLSAVSLRWNMEEELAIRVIPEERSVTLLQLAHLNLEMNGIEDEGAGRLAAVLGQCASLAHLSLRRNWIGAVSYTHLTLPTILRV